jgi:hypothetical protein
VGRGQKKQKTYAENILGESIGANILALRKNSTFMQLTWDTICNSKNFKPRVREERGRERHLGDDLAKNEFNVYAILYNHHVSGSICRVNCANMYRMLQPYPQIAASISKHQMNRIERPSFHIATIHRESRKPAANARG